MRAKKSLGQNFLRDESVSERIVAALDIGTDDTVIEIGPGQGALTTFLVERAKRVIAIEFDRDLISPLRVQFHTNPNLEILNADALSFNFRELAPNGTKLKLVANLPYNISTPILQRLIEHRLCFSQIVLMFQREVVERITAKPATKERGFLSVLVEDAFETETLFDVAPTAFWPVPKVWSSVIRLRPKEEVFANAATFRRLLSAAFAQKRKTILNNLRGSSSDIELTLSSAAIDSRRRAETLTLDEWHRLAGLICATFDRDTH